MKKFIFTTLALIILSYFSASNVLAQSLPCGNIIDSNGDSESIENCTDPFKVTTDPINYYNLLVDGTAYNRNGDIVPVAEGGTSRIHMEGHPLQTNFRWELFKHDGNDYRYFDLEEKFPTSEYFISYLDTYFTDPDVREFYGNLVHRRENGEDISEDLYFTDGSGKIDPTNGEPIATRLQGFYMSADYDFDGSPNRAGSGTYTMLITEYSIYPTNNSIWDKIRHSIIPTAHAQFLEDYRYTLTFNIVEPGDEPTGASSVLFLPGIQASRLFKEGLAGTEDQIWEPNSNQDVGQLAMTEAGESINNIYSKENEIMQEIAFPTLGTNVYKSFAILLITLDITEVIEDWTPFAYDWRLDVNDLATNDINYKNEVKNLIYEIEKLATTSYTGKVTIIGHSNGGLVGKMLISELDRLGKANLVDKLVMIGTPQLGAPKAILAMLHGYDQQALGGLLISSENARNVMRNMPGVYGLLPSSEYFDKSPGVMISADTSNTTASVQAYDQINSPTTLNNFLTDSLNQRNDNVPINEPLTLNSTVLQNSLITKQKLDSWLPPAGVKVYEVVGTGNATIKGFQYQAFPCRLGYLTCSTGNYMKAVPIVTSSGDETVPVISASGQDGDRVTGYIDLFKEGEGVLNNGRTHLDITESPSVQAFVQSIIKFPYLNDTLEIPEYTNVTRNFKVIGVHSPVSLVITDSAGKKAGKIGDEIKEDIFGSQYLDLGDSSYVIVPDETLFTAELQGKDTGVYSITIDTLKNNTQSRTYNYMGASTTPTMKASFAFATSGYTNIKTDFNSDGIIDLEQTLNGQVVTPPVVYSYSLLKTNIKALKLSKVLETVLLVQVDAAIYWDTLKPAKPAYQKLEFAALDTLKATLVVYKQKKYITQTQYNSLEVMINNLRK